MEIDVVGKLPNSNVLTTCDVFSRDPFAVPLRKPDTTSIVRALMQIYAKHAYVPENIITDKETALTSTLVTELLRISDTKVDHATLKHAQINDLLKRIHQKRKQILKINVTAETLQ